mgnify:CR=1 FL=1
MKMLGLAAAAALLAIATPAAAQDEYPLEPAEWVEVAGIKVADGHMLDYAKHLASIWRKAQDFSVSQGWIEGYEILLNTYPREGEPDLYLLTRFTEFESPEEGEERDKLYREHMAMTVSEMEAASGDRAEYRTLAGEMLLRKLDWKE